MKQILVIIVGAAFITACGQSDIETPEIQDKGADVERQTTPPSAEEIEKRKKEMERK